MLNGKMTKTGDCFHAQIRKKPEQCQRTGVLRLA